MPRTPDQNGGETLSLTGRSYRLNGDDETERDVRAELNAEQNGTDPCLVRVTVDRGVVYLTGSAGSFAQKWAIARAAARVVGVKDLRDHLGVLPPADGYREDHHIREAARRALEWDARVPDGLNATVTDGVLRLNGLVQGLSQRDAAEEAVRNLVGVRDVVNEIKVARVPSRRVPADLAMEVDAVLRRRLGVDGACISVAVEDGVVTLSGAVPLYAMLEDIERAVRSVSGAARIDNQLLVA
jgi:osmotically-inducible protein OsmY